MRLNCFNIRYGADRYSSAESHILLDFLEALCIVARVLNSQQYILNLFSHFSNCVDLCPAASEADMAGPEERTDRETLNTLESPEVCYNLCQTDIHPFSAIKKHEGFEFGIGCDCATCYCN